MVEARMKSVPLGNTGVEVSALCLGTMYFGSLIDQATSFQILDCYDDAGGTFLDTANIYAGWVPGFVGGESETLLGRWLKVRGNRSHLFIATKVGGVLHRDHKPLPGSQSGLRALQIEAECEKSLKRLQIDVIDLYYGHVDDRQTPWEETLEAFTRLIKAGKARFVGASNIAAWRLVQARYVSQENRWASYCCVQQRYSYLRPKAGASFAPQLAANDELLDCCRCEGVSLLAYSPLLGGAYSEADRSFPEQYVGPDSVARLAALKEVATQHNAKVNQIVLAWLCQNSPRVIPVIGVDTHHQLRENLRSLDINLSQAQLTELNEAGI
jgi:aryl-alcohol dehydrogenase-like predicted oxidoreductase